MVHGSTKERAEKMRDAATKASYEYHRDGDLFTAGKILEINDLEDDSLALLYNILNGVK